MNADGSGQTRLTNNSVEEHGISWSPDSNRIVFDLSDGIYVVDADGSHQTRLAESGPWSSPAWSPDGTKIAFAANRTGNREIYVMDSDGSNQTRLTRNPKDKGSPVWSPDGTKIAFIWHPDGSSEIHAMNTDGSHQVYVTNCAGGGFRWSPDSSRIAFHSRGLCVVNADGSNPIELLALNSCELRLDWSPDGTRIVFSGGPGGSMGGDIYVISADGSNQRNLSNNPAEDDWPTWRPRRPQGQ
jgi:Tol biopolymer transport system component